MPEPPQGAARLSRHFLAFVPDAAARGALAALAVPPGARPVDPADLHLTLAFLGTLDEEGTARVLGALRGMARPGVRVTLTGLEHWAPSGILCAVGPVADDDPVVEWTGRLQVALAAAGFAAPGRAFRPHVTLARKLPGPARVSVPLPAPVTWNAAALHLMGSLLGAPPGRAGPRYFLAASLPLQG